MDLSKEDKKERWEISKMKISNVWESRDQDMHASPKGAHTEVPTVST
jgi:hypothetical protein